MDQNPYRPPESTESPQAGKRSPWTNLLAVVFGMGLSVAFAVVGCVVLLVVLAVIGFMMQDIARPR